MFQDLFELFYPKTCSCCGMNLQQSEDVICTECLHQLPLNHSWLEAENATAKIFYGRIKITNAASLLLFEKKGMVQQLIHNLKYRGQQEVGSYLGKWMGNKLAEAKIFNDVDAVVPVPLHKKREQARGYNQVEKFGKELAIALKAEYVDDVLLKKTASATQTYKQRLARWGAIEETFILQNEEKLLNKHILLVDDLVTTGATLEACCTRLNKIPNIKISIATMAIAG